MRGRNLRRKRSGMEKTLVWAHRGASGYAPENTMPAFELADEQGADGIELDVQMTRDGELVVIHDERIDRTGDGVGFVKDFTYAELARLNFNKKFPEYGRVQIPTLKEVYQWIKGTDLTVNVEIKTGEIFYDNIEERVLELSERMGVADRVIYSSFNHYTVQRLKQIDETVRTGMLYSDGIVCPVTYAEAVLGADALHPALYNLQYPKFMESCRRAGKKVHVWTVNKEEDMRYVLEQKVDAMITNYPDRGRVLTEQYYDGKLEPELVLAIKAKGIA